MPTTNTSQQSTSGSPLRVEPVVYPSAAQEHATPAEVQRVAQVAQAARLTLSDHIPIEFRHLIVNEWGQRFVEFAPLAQAVPAAVRQENSDRQRGAWLLRKLLEPGGTSHPSLPVHVYEHLVKKHMVPEPPPFTHVRRDQVIVAMVMGDLILEYLRFAPTEKLERFFAFGEEYFQREVKGAGPKEKPATDMGELVDPFEGVQLSSGERLKMDETALSYCTFAHHASWRFAMDTARRAGKQLQALHLDGFGPRTRAEDAPFDPNVRTPAWRRDAGNVLCLSLMYAFYPHLREAIWASRK